MRLRPARGRYWPTHDYRHVRIAKKQPTLDAGIYEERCRMNASTTQAGNFEDAKIDVKIKLSGLWAALMFCYIYGDYFGLYVPEQLKGMLAGAGPIGPVSQGTLIATSVLLAIPGLMVFLSLVLPPRMNRWLNIILGAFYIAVMLVTMPGTWWFYIILGVIEIALGVMTIWYAWTWPRHTTN